MTGEVAQTATGETMSAAEEAEAAAAFTAGFSEQGETPPKPVETPVEAAAVVAAEKVATPASVAETPPEAAKPPPPKYVRVTEEQLSELLATAGKVKEFGSRFDKLAGTTGSLKQALDRLQSETPKGQRFDPAALGELARDFPEIAGHLEKILGGLKGTGTEAPKEATTKPAKAATETATDADSIRREANEKQFSDELAELKDDYPDWAAIVGQSDTPDHKNPFRVWLAKQPADYQTRINDTLSPRVIARAIDRFRATTATPRPAQGGQTPAPKPPAASSRRNLVANAVTPKTAGGQPQAKSETLDDAFHAGFAGR